MSFNLLVTPVSFLAPADLAAAVYARAMEPKSLTILKGGHFEAFQGEASRLQVQLP
jgi:hypothetical protein